jgi:hypothetical protein
MNKTTKPNNQPNLAALQVGYVVALALREPCANNRCFVGQVEAVDDLGVRLTLVDWITGMMPGNDFFAPWDNIIGALVATPAHNKERFERDAASFQTRHNQQPGEEVEENSSI